RGQQSVDDGDGVVGAFRGRQHRDRAFTEFQPVRLAGAQHVEGVRCHFSAVSGACRDERLGGGEHDTGVGRVTDGDRGLCVGGGDRRVRGGGEEIFGKGGEKAADPR